MNAHLNLAAQPREVIGKKVKTLRAKNILPANIFGNTKPKSIQVEGPAFEKVFSHSGETALIQLQVEGEKSARPVLAVGVSRDPVTDRILHVDFQQVNLKVAIEAEIPLEFEGEVPAVKAGLVFLKLRSEIPVRALPADLPEHLTVDVSGLTEVGQFVSVANVAVDASKIEVLLDKEEQLAVIQAQEEEKVEEEPIETVTTVQKTPEELAAEAEAKSAEEKSEE